MCLYSQFPFFRFCVPIPNFLFTILAMGSGSSRKVSCPKCNFRTSDGKQFLTHLTEVHTLKCMQCTKCTKCGQDGFSTESDLTSHYHEEHSPQKNTIKCPKCGQKKFASEIQLLDHLKKSHAFNERTNISLSQNVQKQEPIKCPKCDKELKNTKEFLSHLQNYHMFLPSTMNLRDGEKTGNKKLPKIGDKVLAMWSISVWQYFHATILSFSADTLRYTIEWDDGDTTGSYSKILFLSTCRNISEKCIKEQLFTNMSKHVCKKLF